MTKRLTARCPALLAPSQHTRRPSAEAEWISRLRQHAQKGHDIHNAGTYEREHLRPQPAGARDGQRRLLLPRAQRRVRRLREHQVRAGGGQEPDARRNLRLQLPRAPAAVAAEKAEVCRPHGAAAHGRHCVAKAAHRNAAHHRLAAGQRLRVVAVQQVHACCAHVATQVQRRGAELRSKRLGPADVAQLALGAAVEDDAHCALGAGLEEEDDSSRKVSLRPVREQAWVGDEQRPLLNVPGQRVRPPPVFGRGRGRVVLGVLGRNKASAAQGRWQ